MANFSKWIFGSKIKVSGNDADGYFLSTVDSTTQHIHDGDAYDVSASGTLTAGAGIIALGRTNGKSVHFHGFRVTANQGPVLIEFFEAPTVTDAGTQISTPNRNRQSDKTPTMNVYSGTTVSANGTKLFERSILQSGGGAHEQGGDSADAGEWDLKLNTDYIIKITNQAASSTAWSASFFWYELDF